MLAAEMPGAKPVHQFEPGARVRFTDDGFVFVVGRLDGSCVNIRQDDKPDNAGPIRAWTMAVPA